jgi:hypothetical protein
MNPEPCAACGAVGIHDNYSLEDDHGDERAICEKCGGEASPTVPELQAMIRNRDAKGGAR